MTEQLETIPKEEKAEKEARRSSLEKHRKEKPFKTGRGRISTPERKIAKKEPSTVSRDEVRRKKGSFHNHFFINVFEVIHYFSQTISQFLLDIHALYKHKDWTCSLLTTRSEKQTSSFPFPLPTLKIIEFIFWA